MSRPVFTIIAGSNGCGKSTLTATARDKFQQTPVLDPDAIAKSLQAILDSNTSNIEAGKRVLRLAEELIAKGQTFTVETTLSGGTYLKDRLLVRVLSCFTFRRDLKEDGRSLPRTIPHPATR